MRTPAGDHGFRLSCAMPDAAFGTDVLVRWRRSLPEGANMTILKMASVADLEELLHAAGEVDAQHRLPEGNPEADADLPHPERGEALFARIAERAHDLWRAEGCRENSAPHDWLLAEQQVLAEISGRD